MTLLGTAMLWLALAMAVGIAGLVVSGRWRRDQALEAVVIRSAYVLAGLMGVAAIALWVGIFRHDFNIAYVASYTARNLPTGYLFASFWAGQAGSLLFWAVVLALFAAAAQLLTPRHHAHLLPYVAGVTASVLAFFLIVMLFAASPFERLGFVPPDGRGMNPQLQNPGMMIHPPMLYLGYISITIPFAFAVAALVSGRLDTGWLHAIRRWTLVSWLFLSIGITLGMWWAYVELGWGGYWAWDPVENASFLPWLTMTAFLHSVMMQEKRGMLKRWNLMLIAGSFLLSIFGTFITRSGVIASVHSFTQSSVGYYFLVFLLLAAVFSFVLIWSRWPRLEAEVELDSMVSREAAFLFNNLALVGIAFSVLWGTLFPIISELVRDTKITVGPPFFNRVNVPLGLLLLALTGIGPLIAWRKASAANLRRQFVMPVAAGLVTLALLLVAGARNGYAIMAIALGAFVTGAIVQEFWRGVRARVRMHSESVPVALARLVARNRRRYGGYLVHVGIVIFFVAFAGMAFKTETEATLRPGESVELVSPFGHTYRFLHEGVSQYESLNRFVSAAAMRVFRDGKDLGLLVSEKRQHVDASGQPTFEPSTEVGIRSDLREDIYLVYAGSVQGTEEAVYRVAINPLVWWVWAGGFVLTIGGLITMWPGGMAVRRAVERAPARREPAPDAGLAGVVSG